jgi:hypothetical protein
MPTFPASQVLGGAGTFVLLPDGKVINYSTLADYVLDVATFVITFSFTTGAPYAYNGPTLEYSRGVMFALSSIPAQPSSYYVITSMIPTFSILSLSAITGAAAGGDTITVTGVGFVDGLVANLGGTVAAATFISSTSFSFITPAGTAVGTNAPVNLTVRNPDGTETVLPNAFTYT